MMAVNPRLTMAAMTAPPGGPASRRAGITTQLITTAMPSHVPPSSTCNTLTVRNAIWILLRFWRTMILRPAVRNGANNASEALDDGVVGGVRTRVVDARTGVRAEARLHYAT